MVEELPAGFGFFQPCSVYGVCSHLIVKRSTRAALDGLSPSAPRFNPDTTSAAPPGETAEEREVAPRQRLPVATVR